LSLELGQKKEELESELRRRIDNIMENERHNYQNALKEAEREIFEVNKTAASVTANFERMQKDLIAAQNENKVVSRQVTLLLEEKALMAVELQYKLENERLKSDSEKRSQQGEVEDLIEKVRNLEFSLESSRIKAQDFEERYS